MAKKLDLDKLNVDWGKLAQSLEPRPPLFSPHQPYFKQKVFLLTTALEVLYGGRAGGGKALALDTEIPTPTGLKLMSDISPGDFVYDEGGTPRVVMAESEIMTDKECFRMVFDDGSSIITSDDHLWLSHTYKARLGREEPQLLTTREICSTSRIHKSQRVNHAIAVAGPVEGSHDQLLIDPYVLGIWLGDGRANAGSITTADAEVIEEFRLAGYAPRRQPSMPYGWGIPGLVTELKSIGVLNDKHIPSKYLLSSAKNRLALLQGLMDSDGNSNNSGSVEFCNTNKRLVEDTLSLILSLGHKATITEGRATLNGKDCGPKYRIKWTPPELVFRLERKTSRQNINNRRGTQEFRYITSVEKIQSVPVKCIRTSAPSGLFLATRAHIPTHNSDALLMAALQYVDVPGYSAMLFRNSFSDLVLPGALMDRARDWLEPHIPEVRWSSKTNSWVFPSGATVTFGYLEKPDDHLRYKGAEFQFVGFDEVTEIREKHYTYLFSRLRKPSEGPLSRVPLRARGATNPAPNWVRERFIERPIYKDIEGNKRKRIYIPAGVDDNPFVDKKSYRQALSMLDSVERARLEAGDWWAEEAGSKFQREWFPIIDADEVPEASYHNMVRYWDIASTLPSESNKDPDWTAGALVSAVDGIMIVHDIKRARRDAGGVEDLIYQTAQEDGPSVKIRMEQEPGASGKITIDHYARHILPGFDFDGNPAIRNKESRVDAWAGNAKRKHVMLVRPRGRDWISDFLDEATSFGAIKDGHDDQLDAISGAFEVLFQVGKKKGKGRLEIIV